MPISHPGQDIGADHMLCDDRQPGGIPVQAVRTPEDKRLILLLIIPHQRICKGITVVLHGWVHGQSCRLIDHQDVLILINDLKGDVYRRNFFGALCLPDPDHKLVSC